MNGSEKENTVQEQASLRASVHVCAIIFTERSVLFNLVVFIVLKDTQKILLFIIVIIYRLYVCT